MADPEAQLQRAVLDLCQYRHVLVHHCRPAMLQSGRIATPIQGNAGFVDLVIAGTAGVLWRELKSEDGRPSKAQAAWIALLNRSGADVAIWRPSDLTSGRIQREIEAVARGV